MTEYWSGVRKDFWIGAKQDDNNASVYTQTFEGPSLDSTSDVWVIGTPNDPKGEYCVVSWKGLDQKLDDAPCSNQYYFLCQVKRIIS